MNSSMLPQYQLKKPIFVWIIGCCFIISPFFNMALALFFGNDYEWYLPAHWMSLYRNQDLLQKVILALVPAAGVSLLIQRKTAWMFAVCLIVAGSIQNVYAFFTQDGSLV